MSAEFRLPDLGEGLTDAEIVRWLVDVGDRVTVDQPVVEVETAKAAVEVPTPYAGVVTALHATAGESVPVGAPLLSVAEQGTNGSGNVLVGYGTSDRKRRRGGRNRASAAPSGPGPVPVISPVVRKLARDNGIDLRALHGSGPGGLVRRADVQAAIDGTRTTAPHGEGGDVQRIPLTGVRGAIAARLSRSRREIPEATVWVDVDATEFLRARAEINRADPRRPVSILALLSRFCLLGLARFPMLNSTVDTERNEIVVHRAVHLGFAARTPRGLMVPVSRDAQRRTTRELSADLDRLATMAREGSLPPSDLVGGTFTVNNYGVFGVDGSAAIINHPEAAILGMGRIIDRPWVVDGRLTVRKVTELTLAFDHRVCDGDDAGGFLRFVADCLESPTALLGDL